MSSSHTKKFFLNLSRQKEGAIIRRQARHDARRSAYDVRCQQIKVEVTQWYAIQSMTLLAWLSGMAGVMAIGLTFGRDG